MTIALSTESMRVLVNVSVRNKGFLQMISLGGYYEHLILGHSLAQVTEGTEVGRQQNGFIIGPVSTWANPNDFITGRLLELTEVALHQERDPGINEKYKIGRDSTWISSPCAADVVEVFFREIFVDGRRNFQAKEVQRFITYKVQQ